MGIIPLKPVPNWWDVTQDEVPYTRGYMIGYVMAKNAALAEYSYGINRLIESLKKEAYDKYSYVAFHPQKFRKFRGH